MKEREKEWEGREKEVIWTVKDIKLILFNNFDVILFFPILFSLWHQIGVLCTFDRIDDVALGYYWEVI